MSTPNQQEGTDVRNNLIVPKELRARALHIVRRMPASTIEERYVKNQARMFVVHRHRTRKELEAFCDRMENKSE